MNTFGHDDDGINDAENVDAVLTLILMTILLLMLIVRQRMLLVILDDTEYNDQNLQLIVKLCIFNSLGKAAGSKALLQ